MESTTVSVGRSARAYGTRPNIPIGNSKSLMKIYSLNKSVIATNNKLVLAGYAKSLNNSKGLMKNGFHY